MLGWSHDGSGCGKENPRSSNAVARVGSEPRKRPAEKRGEGRMVALGSAQAPFTLALDTVPRRTPRSGGLRVNDEERRSRANLRTGRGGGSFLRPFSLSRHGSNRVWMF